MKPTLEQIKTDESVWPENATHYNRLNKLFYIFGELVFVQNENGEWLEINVKPEDTADYIGMITRPTKAFVPEVGIECEYKTCNGKWLKCFYIGVDHNGSNVFCTDDSIWRDIDLTDYRPIKSEREKFQESVKAKIPNADTDDIIFAGKLFDAGFIKEPTK